MGVSRMVCDMAVEAIVSLVLPGLLMKGWRWEPQIYSGARGLVCLDETGWAPQKS